MLLLLATVAHAEPAEFRLREPVPWTLSDGDVDAALETAAGMSPVDATEVVVYAEGPDGIERPLVEYLAPRTYRNRTDTKLPWFVGPRIARLVEELQRLCPPERDPLLSSRSAANRRLPVAGAAFHRARLWQVMGREDECREAWQGFVEAWTGRQTQAVDKGI